MGNLATVTDAAGTRTFSYNDTFDLISETINGIYSKVISRSYTATGAKGKVLGMNIGNIQNYTYAYDAYGRLNKITTPAGDFNYTRLTDSDLIAQMTRPNGVSTTWNYESHRNLITEVNNGGISIFGYANNAIGNRAAMSRSGTAFPTPDTLSYTYDDRSEVTGASSNVDQNYNYAYNFDPIGNRITGNLAGTAFSYTSNGLNQYTTINTEQPTYDADGNMLTRDGWTQVWNGENRLIETSKGDTRLTFAYDYMGRRIEKKVYTSGTLTKDIRFVYDGYKLIEELDALNNNTSLRRYTWQPASLVFDTLLSVYDMAQAKTYCYHSDANKNVTELTNSEGMVVAHYECSPFGLLSKQSGNYAETNVFSFSSEYYDREINLIYYNYRYYTPRIGRWLNRDPMGEYSDLNLQMFVNNRVSVYWDTLGLVCCGGEELPPEKKCCGDEKSGSPYDPKTECCCNNKTVYKRSIVQAAVDAMKKTLKDAETAANWGMSDYRRRDSDGEYDWQCYDQAEHFRRIFVYSNNLFYKTKSAGRYVSPLNRRGFGQPEHHAVRIYHKCRTGDCPGAGDDFIIDPLAKNFSGIDPATWFGKSPDDKSEGKYL